MAWKCDYCHTPIAPGAHPFTLRLELFPAVEPSLQISEQEMEASGNGQDLRELLRIMEEMSDEEVARQEKIVYFSHKFTLCPACRHTMAGALERLLPDAGQS